MIKRRQQWQEWWQAPWGRRVPLAALHPHRPTPGQWTQNPGNSNWTLRLLIIVIVIVNYLWNEIFHDYHVVLYIILQGPPATYQVPFSTINNHLLVFIKMFSEISIKFLWELVEFDLSCNSWEAHKGSFQLRPILSNYFLLTTKKFFSSAKNSNNCSRIFIFHISYQFHEKPFVGI